MLKKIKKYLLKRNFNPGLIGLFINPFFFARQGLYNHIKKLGIEISGKTLDVGCGQKPYESLFKSSEYIGMDIEQSGHDHKESHIDVFYDGKTFPFADAEFDSVVTNQVLEHVFEPEQFLKEIHRVLKSNGVLLLTVPFVWDEHEQPYDYARYSSFGIKFLIEKNGFEIINSMKTVNNFSIIFQLINAYIYKILNQNIATKIVARLLIIPFNILGIIFSFLLPKNNDLYLDNIILAKKK